MGIYVNLRNLARAKLRPNCFRIRRKPHAKCISTLIFSRWFNCIDRKNPSEPVLIVLNHFSVSSWKHWFGGSKLLLLYRYALYIFASVSNVHWANKSRSLPTSMNVDTERNLQCAANASERKRNRRRHSKCLHSTSVALMCLSYLQFNSFLRCIVCSLFILYFFRCST